KPGHRVVAAGQVAGEVDEQREEREERGPRGVAGVTVLRDAQVEVGVLDQEVPGPRVAAAVDRVRAVPGGQDQQPGHNKDEKGKGPGVRQPVARRLPFRRSRLTGARDPGPLAWWTHLPSPYGPSSSAYAPTIRRRSELREVRDGSMADALRGRH